MLNEKLKMDFPIFEKNPSLIYLNNAATTLKPRQVIEAINQYYKEISANTGRGSHKLSTDATICVEETRNKTASLINAKENEIAFTKNTTESINTIAVSLERAEKIKEGDEIILSFAEHHANILPWTELAKRIGAKIKVVKLKQNFTFDLEDFRNKISRKTKLVSVAGITNTTGSIFPIKEITKTAHDFGALVSIDGAQLIPHTKIDSKKIGFDFLSFSAHKMLGPTGLGVLFAKEEIVKNLNPYNFGGGIIKSVSFDKVEYVDDAKKFEAGTLQIGEIYGFKETLAYLKKIGLENIEEHDKSLLDFAIAKLTNIEDIVIYGPKDEKLQSGIILFEIKNVDSGDLAIALSEYKNIAVRSGFMCAEPIIRNINPNGLCRASFYIYNNKKDIETLAETIQELSKGLRK
ncbi:MAG: cysteine desulfurase [Candidatus Diapherotrites archaeon]